MKLEGSFQTFLNTWTLFENGTKECLIERSNFYQKHCNSSFYEASCRFSIFCSGRFFDSFVVDICYHKSCCIKYTINPTEISAKNHNDKVINSITRSFIKLYKSF